MPAETVPRRVAPRAEIMISICCRGARVSEPVAGAASLGASPSPATIVPRSPPGDRRVAANGSDANAASLERIDLRGAPRPARAGAEPCRPFNSTIARRNAGRRRLETPASGAF